MGDEQRPEAHGQVGGEPEQPQRVEPGGEAAPTAEKRHEQQAHGNTGDDIRVHHGDVVDGHQGVTNFAAHGIEADGGEGAGHGGDEGGQDGDGERRTQGAQNFAVLEQLPVPVQGEAGPDGAALAAVEGEYDQYENGGVQKEEDQGHEQAASDTAFVSHSMTAVSSPSPNRFMTTMQMTTITIITREMAAPR